MRQSHLRAALGLILSSVLAALAACGGGGDATATTASSTSGVESSTAAAAPAQATAADDGAASAVPPAVADALAAAAADPATDTQASDTAATAPTEAAAAASNGSDAQRIGAASATAQSAAPCNAVRPFYWEVGTAKGRSASGSLAAPGNKVAYTASTAMPIASASKWVYASFVVQKQAGVLSASDRKYLSMLSGYASLTRCEPGQTVDSCLAYRSNGTYTAADDGKFAYDGGHMQKHASLMGLGALNNDGLRAAVQAQLGTDVALAYTSPQIAGGLVMTADGYARMLRKILGGQLRIKALLGSGAVCTNPGSCASGQAVSTPVPSTESWHYSVGHWVEDDPVVGDGAFSSAGSFGFYPWIDAGKTSYGILARVAKAGSGYASAQCGRLIRKAWTTGIAQS